MRTTQSQRRIAELHRELKPLQAELAQLQTQQRRERIAALAKKEGWTLHIVRDLDAEGAPPNGNLVASVWTKADARAAIDKRDINIGVAHHVRNGGEYRTEKQMIDALKKRCESELLGVEIPVRVHFKPRS